MALMQAAARAVTRSQLAALGRPARPREIALSGLDRGQCSPRACGLRQQLH